MTDNNQNNNEQLIEKRKKDNIFLYSFICGLVVLVFFIVFLLFSSESKVFDVTVSGNIYFDEQDVRKIGDVNNNYFLNVPFLIENKLKKHPLINDAKVSLLDGKIINLEIEEKKMIGYRLTDEGAFEAICADNTRYTLKDNEIYLISNAPQISIANEDKMEKLCKNMDELEPEIIKQISEVNSYPFTYDPDMYEFVMADGNYCFVSLNDINKIVEYYSISFNIDQDVGHACIYIGDFTISAYSSTCPWQEQK